MTDIDRELLQGRIELILTDSRLRRRELKPLEILDGDPDLSRDFPETVSKIKELFREHPDSSDPDERAESSADLAQSAG